MATKVTADEFNRTGSLPDWRYLLNAIEAVFDAPSFGEAAQFVAKVGEAADRADHHPDIDLRYPGVVHITLSTHYLGGLTDLDLALARTISELATEAGYPARPTAPQRLEVAIDALAINAVRPFWMAVLGYVDGPTESGETANVIVDPAGIGPAFWFQPMAEPRPQRNRIHLDVTVPHDEAEARVAAALAAGGTLVTDRWARSYWVLADPEGNEACVCTWEDRDQLD